MSGCRTEIEEEVARRRRRRRLSGLGEFVFLGADEQASEPGALLNADYKNLMKA